MNCDVFPLCPLLNNISRLNCSTDHMLTCFKFPLFIVFFISFCYFFCVLIIFSHHFIVKCLHSCPYSFTRHSANISWLIDRRLWSSTSHHLEVLFVRLYSRQAGVSGFWCHRLERPASPRRICAITRGFQTTTQDLFVFPFLPRHYHMTHVNTITIHHYCLDTCGPCSN